MAGCQGGHKLCFKVNKGKLEGKKRKERQELFWVMIDSWVPRRRECKIKKIGAGEHIYL